MGTALPRREEFPLSFKNLTFRSLEYVITLAEEGNFTRAAQRLYITQPSLSQAIKRIEQDCGTPLFQRMKNRVILTEDGQCFIETGKQVLNLMDGLEQEIRERSQLARGVLTIGTGYMLGSILVSKLMANFRRRYPGFTPRLVEAPSSNLEISTANGEIDLCLVLLPVREPSLCTKPLLSGQILLVMSKDNPLNRLAFRPAGSDEIFFDLKDARSATFIRSREGNRTETINDTIFSKAGFSPRVSMQVRNIATALQLVSGSNDLFLLPDLYLHGLQNPQRQHALNSYYLKDGWSEWTLVAAYLKKGCRNSKPIQAFLDMLDENISGIVEP